ncbi:DUF3772 domain-containing protein [Paracoccus sediminis]|uniref:DUF3772 domain-containing protein n=1 Tax=Paracoccus sediminis TaxID=1214787 RepID=A0A238WAX7_9RHOB|nr:DUF3772 domain-containing protein [Paracoccus sediminis]TBN50978.1 DUF3772 domain-containing protein [Paracoccus sediminis]SNR43700.1 Small-conductance mechanosensitive channel [Paracoccus sediminis]
MIRAFLAVVLTVLSLALSPVLAQDMASPDYGRWEQAATQAEQLAGSGETATAQLEAIRADIVEWRRQFDAAQGVNGDRIATLESQIAALGPAPAEGETEAEDIAARRADLQRQLSESLAPRLTAVEAFSRADAIIRQIDTALGARAASQMAQQSPSPLLPGNWILALSETRQLVDGILSNTRQRISERATWPELRPRLPYVLGYLAAAILLLTLGRRWVENLPSRISARTSDYSRAAVTFVVSLLQIALPMAGIFLLVNALTATEIFGPWTRPFLEALPGAGVILFGGAWLARQLFPRQSIAYDTLNMRPEDRQNARWLTDALAAVFAVHYVASQAFLPLSGLVEGSSRLRRIPLDFAEGAASVYNLVLIALAAALLFKLGNILRRLKPADRGSTAYRHRVLAFAGMLTRIVSILAVALTAAGFVNLGNLATWPWLQTLGMLGLLVLLQDFIADVFNLLKRGQEGAREGLAPLLIGFALIVLSVPVFLLIWGVSVNELAEYWVSFRQGVTLGGVRLSPGAVLMFIVVFAIGYSITRGIQGAMRTSVLPKTRLDAGGQNAVVSGIGYVGIVLAAMLAISSAGIDLSSFAIVAGALSVGIGFGLQNIVSNFVSGIILLIERPVSVGDWISAGGQQGIVKRISVRSTQVETFDKQQVIVPNTDLISQPVTNWTRQSKTGRIIIPIGVSYGADTRKVARILTEIIEDQPLVTIDPAPAVLFRGITVDALNFEIRAVISDVGSGLSVTSEVYHQIVERFIREGIGMPFTTRDIWKDGKDLPPADIQGGDPVPPPPVQNPQRELPDDGDR